MLTRRLVVSIVCGLAAAALPFVASALIVTPFSLAALLIRHCYYSVARLVMGDVLFPAAEFGVGPANGLAIVLASGLFGTTTALVMLLLTRNPAIQNPHDSES